MDFSFTEEQEQLRASVRAFLRDRYTFEARRAAVESSSSLSLEVWAAFADELGILGLSLPERVGGLALDAVSSMVLLEEFGRALVVEPYIETVIVCGGLLARAGGAAADHLLARIADGGAVVALAAAEPHSRDDLAHVTTTARRESAGWRLDGVKAVVSAAPWASHLLVTARTGGADRERRGISLFLVEQSAAGVSLQAYATIDGRRAADVVFNNVRAPLDALIGDEGQAHDSIEHAMDEAIAAIGAEAGGVLSRLLEDTLEYTRSRRQFGRPLSDFQALQHRIIDMYMELELTRAAVCRATLKLGASPHERGLAASAAKVMMNQACRFVGQNAVQMHGGIGLTHELAVSHLFKRATAIESEFGGADFHLARYAALTRMRVAEAMRP